MALFEDDGPDTRLARLLHEAGRHVALRWACSSKFRLDECDDSSLIHELTQLDAQFTENACGRSRDLHARLIALERDEGLLRFDFLSR